MALLSHTPDGENPTASHNLNFVGEMQWWNEFEENSSFTDYWRSFFFQEFYSLIQVVKPFTNKSAAACYEYVNSSKLTIIFFFSILLNYHWSIR